MTAAVACSRGRAPARDEGAAPAAVDPLEHLRAFERARRAEARFLEAPLQDRALGADPYDVAVLRDGRHPGIPRGRDAPVVLHADLREVARVPTPRLPSA